MASMEEEFANLSTVDEEDDPVHDQEEEDEFNLCLVGKALTNSAIHFPSMRSMLAEYGIL